MSAALNLGIKTSVLKSRIQTMKKAGVKVPNKAESSDNLNSDLYIAQLNSLINKFNKEK